MSLLKWPPPPPPLAITANVPREIITATAASDAVTAFKVELPHGSILFEVSFDDVFEKGMATERRFNSQTNGLMANT
jgi:hypothetical protein